VPNAAPHHQGLHRKLFGVEFGQQGQGESGCFAAAGFGLGDQVFACQRQRQGGRLDGRHLVIAQLRQIRQGGGWQGQSAEGQRGA
jgi:hypothetical protein